MDKKLLHKYIACNTIHLTQWIIRKSTKNIYIMGRKESKEIIHIHPSIECSHNPIETIMGRTLKWSINNLHSCRLWAKNTNYLKSENLNYFTKKKECILNPIVIRNMKLYSISINAKKSSKIWNIWQGPPIKKL